MSFQYTYDAKGNPVGVFIPIAEWKKISAEPKNKKIIKKSGALKEKILLGIDKGMKQVKDIENGKLKSISLKQLLNAL